MMIKLRKGEVLNEQQLAQWIVKNRTKVTAKSSGNHIVKITLVNLEEIQDGHIQ